MQQRREHFESNSVALVVSQGLIKQEPLVGNGDDAARYHIEETQSLAEDHYSYGQSQHSSLLHLAKR